MEQAITIDQLQKEFSELKLNYEELQSAHTKLKETNSKTNSEMAELKRQEKSRLEKEKEKMSIEEKTSLELDTLRKQVQSYELKDTLLAQGYTAKEVEKLMSENCSPKVYAEIMAERMKEQENSLKAQSIATSTPNLILGGGQSKVKETLGEQLAKSRATTVNQDAKNYYNK